MYDNLPFVTEDLETIKCFLNSEKLLFSNESIKYDKETGVELRTTYFRYRNLTISVKYNINGRPIELKSKGSFHYLLNNGLHNADNKTFTELKNFLLDFEKLFNIDLRNLKLAPSEFAVNIKIPYDVEDVIQNCYYEQRKPFNDNSVGNPSIISGSNKNDYQLKIYSKSHDHPEHCRKNTLRLEYKAIRSRSIKSFGIVMMSDLLVLKNWIRIMDYHSELFKNLVLYDFSIRLPRNSKHKTSIINFSNKNYWKNLLKSINKGIIYNTKYNDEVTTLNLLSEKYGNDILSNILELSKKQWISNMGLCKERSVFTKRKPKDAQLLKPKDAPFIVCIPCNHYQKIEFSDSVINEKRSSTRARG